MDREQRPDLRYQGLVKTKKGKNIGRQIIGDKIPEDAFVVLAPLLWTQWTNLLKDFRDHLVANKK